MGDHAHRGISAQYECLVERFETECAWPYRLGYRRAVAEVRIVVFLISAVLYSVLIIELLHM